MAANPSFQEIKRNKATPFVSKRGAQTKIMTKNHDKLFKINSDNGGEKRGGDICL